MTCNILFLHQNFPGQYKLLSRELGSRDGFKAVALGQKSPFGVNFGPVSYEGYQSGPDHSSDLFPPLTFFSEQVRRGDMVRGRLQDLKRRGFTPDVCFAHPGWGEALFVKEVFPETKLISYLEYYYRSQGSDLDFDREFQSPSVDMQYVSLRNLPTLQAAALSDALVSPTRWQAGSFPPPLSERINVIHEGIDTDVAKPGPARPLAVSRGTIQPGQTLITYSVRSLEPYRGFHSFMRALPHLQALLPEAHVAIVGKEPTSYGRNPSQGRTWKQVMVEEIESQVDWERVHFLGTLPYDGLINLFRLSTVHVYLTYPFILSWSLLDAMASGCAIVGSSTGPVVEVIQDGYNGVLADFFDAQALAERIASVASDRDLRQQLSENARQTVLERYDFKTVCWPAYERLMNEALAL
ncbi:glycosyltransferase [Microvirga sp. VF16]|uniref:glycosyltransferase n=1 Tax=Microvirga sp. VF16 TaxID=2807101 RepID=UPI00193D5449|nr:glycosyltransferase [Microvirga sp. VF16]QRM35587.1 glycosyltransferase [Microvirga sp. VF16]